MTNKYDGYKWIKIKKYKMDESLSCEERYKQLEAHHIEETTFLIDEIRMLSQSLEEPLSEEVIKRLVERSTVSQDVLDEMNDF